MRQDTGHQLVLDTNQLGSANRLWVKVPVFSQGVLHVPVLGRFQFASPKLGTIDLMGMPVGPKNKLETPKTTVVDMV